MCASKWQKTDATPPAQPYTPTWVCDPSPERSPDVVKRLDTIFLMAEKPMSDEPNGHDDEIRRILMKPKEDAPVLTKEHVCVSGNEHTHSSDECVEVALPYTFTRRTYMKVQRHVHSYRECPREHTLGAMKF